MRPAVQDFAVRVRSRPSTSKEFPAFERALSSGQDVLRRPRGNALAVLGVKIKKAAKGVEGRMEFPFCRVVTDALWARQ